MKECRVKVGAGTSVAAAMLAICVVVPTSAAEPFDYLRVVQSYADALLEHGTDKYGTAHSPLIATTLDRKTLRLFEGESLTRILDIPRKHWGIRPHTRGRCGR